MSTVNLFAKAAEAAPAKTAKAAKLLIPVKAGDKIAQLTEIREQMSNLKAKEALLADDIKTFGEEQFLKLYKQGKARPESFVLQDEAGGKVLVIIQDKYAKVEQATEDTIREVYKDQADELIEKTTVYKLDADLVQKHGEKLSKAIMGIKGMTDEEKASLISADQVTAIKKGTIERLTSFPKFDTLFSLIKPTFQLKNQK